MTVLLLIFVSALLLVTIVIWPRLAMVLVWPILLLYPNNLWNQANLLPLAIGFDDLFIVLAAIVVFLRHNLGGRRPVYVGFPVFAALVYFLLAGIANANGYARVEHDVVSTQNVIKDVLKLGVMALFTYSLANTVENARDLRRILFAMSIGIALAGALAIASYFRPELCNYFWDVEAAARERVLFRRATGSLIYANILGIVMALGITLTLLILGLTRAYLSKLILLVCAAVMFVAIVMSQSRTGLVCLGAGLLTMFFLRGHRRWVILSLALLILATPFLAPLYEPLGERFSRAFHPDLGQLGPNVQARLEIQGGYISSLDARSVALGSGMRAARDLAGTEQKPHNGYLDVLCYYGIGGVVWLLAVIFGVQWRVRYLRRSHLTEGPVQTGNVVLVFCIIFAAASFTADTFASPFPLYLFWTALALVDRAARIAREGQNAFLVRPVASP